jgi:hypothetical protein
LGGRKSTSFIEYSKYVFEVSSFPRKKDDRICSLRKTEQMLLAAQLLALMATAGVTLAACTGSDAVDLSNVRALTFRRGQMTSSRRVAAVPQVLCCVSGSRSPGDPED